MSEARATIDVQEIIVSALREVADIHQVVLPALSESTPILRLLDSLALVALVATIEMRLAQLGHDVTIVSERAFSAKRSPFLTVKTLREHLNLLIQERRAEDVR